MRGGRTLTLLVALATLGTPACGRYTETLRAVPEPASSCTDGPAITLRYAWPDRAHADVVGSYTIDEWSEPLRENGRGDRVRTEASQPLQMVIEAQGPDHRLGFVGPGPASGTFRLHGLAPHFDHARPQVVLGPDGRVTRVDGVAAMAAAQTAAHRSDRSHGSSRYTTQRRQRAFAAAHWDYLIGLWNGVSLSCGQSISHRRSVQVPSLAGREMWVQLRQMYLGDAPCGADDPRRCVNLRVTMRARSSQVTSAFEPRSVGRGLRPLDATDGQLYRVLDLRAEPDTLLPHQISVVERSQVGWSNLRETPSRYTTHMHDVQRYTFRYRAGVSGRLPATRVPTPPRARDAMDPFR